MRLQLIKQTTTGPTYTTFRNTTQFGSLNGLRCLCIVAVIWHHSGLTGNAWPLLNRGFLGVDLFFVISGFLIVTLLLRERSGTNAISLRNFYIRRGLRILPLYYGIIFGLAAVYLTVGKHSVFGMRFLNELPYYLTFVADFFPVTFAIVWSLAAEEQFYIFWPSIEKYLASRVGVILVVLFLLNQVVNFPFGKSAITNLVGNSNWRDLSISQTTFTPIILGISAAHLMHSKTGYRLLRNCVSSRWASSVYALLLIGILSVEPEDISGWPRLLIQICMTALVLSCVYRENHMLRWVLACGPVRNVGKISYGMYLMHIQVIGLLTIMLHGRYEHGSFRLFLCSLMVTIFVAELSYRFFEMRFLMLKRKYSVL